MSRYNVSSLVNFIICSVKEVMCVYHVTIMFPPVLNKCVIECISLAPKSMRQSCPVLDPETGACFLGPKKYTPLLYIYIGGSRGRAGCTPPPWDPILLFLHTFSLKSAHVGGPSPPNGCMPPLREILDPPLICVSSLLCHNKTLE